MTRLLLCVLVGLMGTGCGSAPVPGIGSMDRTRLADFYRERGGIEAVARGPVAFFDNGPAIKQAMLKRVQEARHYLLLDTFLLSDGIESRPVLDALVEKHRQGVKVHVIGDSSSRFVEEPHAFDYLEEKGVPCAEFHRIGKVRFDMFSRLFEREHRKFWISDGRSLFLGGANLNDPSLKAPASGGNLDLMVRMDSPEAVNELVASFVETWNQCDQVQPLDISDFILPTQVTTKDKGTRFWLFNQDFRSSTGTNTEAMFDGLFASARQTIWLIQPYTFVNPLILSRVRELSNRGVKVNVILSTQARAPRFRYASFFGIKDLLDAGAEVWMFDSSVTPLHHKGVLVDDQLACVGSSNLNFRSYRLSRELNVVLEDADSVARMRQVVCAIRSGSRRVTREEALGYRSPKYRIWWRLMQLAG